MIWFLIALLGPMLSSLCNQLDRFFLGRYFAGETLGALLIFSSLIGVVVLPVAWAFSDPFGGYSPIQTVLLVAAGISGVYGIYLYLLDFLFGKAPWSRSLRGALLTQGFREVDAAAISMVIARLGVSDVRAFGLTWEDCEELLKQLGYIPRVEVVAA